ncbi:MAG: DUF2835 family protein [Thiohalomonadales bacterium]
MTVYEFNLQLSAEKIQAYYAGAVKHVVAQDIRGIKVQFPVAVLRPFVTNNGINGRFIIRMDTNNRFVDIRQLS